MSHPLKYPTSIYFCAVATLLGTFGLAGNSPALGWPAYASALLLHLSAITFTGVVVTVVLKSRKNALDELHNSNQEIARNIHKQSSELEKFKAIIAQSPEEVYLNRFDGRISYCNETALKNLGYLPEELLQLRIQDIAPGFLEGAGIREFQSVKEKPVSPFEVWHKTKDGRLVPKEMRLLPLVIDGQGYCCAFARDISKRKQAEAALVESEGKFRTLAETSPAAIVILQEGQIRYINPAAEKITGYTLEELINVAFDRIVYSEDRKDISQRAQKRLDEGLLSGEHEFRFIRKDGDVRWFSYSASRLTYEGKPAIIGSAFDITERKENVLKLQESEERYRNIFSAVNDVIFILDPDNLKLIDCNPRAMELFGFSFEELCQKGASRILPAIPPYTVKDSLQMINKVLNEGPHSFEWLCQKKSGETFWTEVGLQCLTLGGQRRIVMVVRDISERKQAEEWTKEQEKVEALKESDRLKDQFLSIVSHELRTPLNAVMGFGSLLEDGVFGPLQPEQNEAVVKMMDGANRMLGLVNNLLDLARIQAGALDFSYTDVYYGDLMREAIAFLKPLADEKNIHLHADIPELEPTRLDGERLFQLLSNLITNAIKFSNSGTEIRIRAYQEDGAIITEVSDTGIGIAPEDLSKLFIPFKQLDMSLTRKIGGTGLGLSISKGIVEAHGGTIEVASLGLNKGTTFRFSLPLKTEREDLKEAEALLKL